jgi:hypothetical protein
METGQSPALAVRWRSARTGTVLVIVISLRLDASRYVGRAAITDHGARCCLWGRQSLVWLREVVSTDDGKVGAWIKRFDHYAAGGETCIYCALRTPSWPLTLYDSPPLAPPPRDGRFKIMQIAHPHFLLVLGSVTTRLPHAMAARTLTPSRSLNVRSTRNNPTWLSSRTTS